jgi:outer membrane protein TolC
MHFARWIRSLIVSAATICTVARAQEPLTLERCLSLASQNSPQLRIADNAIRFTELSLSELRTTGLPQIKVSASAIFTPIPPTFGYDPAISNGGQIAGQVIVQQSLYDAGIRGLKGDQFETDLARLTTERRLVHEDLVLAVTEAFVDGLRAREEVRLQSESVVRLDGYRNLVAQLHRGGTASYPDLLKTEVQTTSALIALEKARESYATARLSLAELIGTPGDTTGSPEGSLATLTGTLAESLASAPAPDPSANLDMSVAGLSVRRSLVEHDLAAHERFPDISVFADAGYLTSGENLRVPVAERLHSFGYSVGIGIEIPILNWGATGLRVQERELATDDLRQKMESLRRSLVSDCRKLQLQLINARDRLGRLHDNAAKAEQNYLLTKSTYAAGGTTALEVLSAQMLLTEGKLAELQTMADVQLLAVRLRRLLVHAQSNSSP